MEAICRALNTKKPAFKAVSTDPTFHPGRCAALEIDGKTIGLLGQIHPLVARNYDVAA